MQPYETLYVAIITGLVSLAVCIITQAATNMRTKGMLEYRLDKLEEKIDKSLLSRLDALENKIHDLEKQLGIHEEEIKVANHRIEDLEKK